MVCLCPKRKPGLRSQDLGRGGIRERKMETGLGRDLGRVPLIPEHGEKPISLEHEKVSRMFRCYCLGSHADGGGTGLLKVTKQRKLV